MRPQHPQHGAEEAGTLIGHRLFHRRCRRALCLLGFPGRTPNTFVCKSKGFPLVGYSWCLYCCRVSFINGVVTFGDDAKIGNCLGFARDRVNRLKVKVELAWVGAICAALGRWPRGTANTLLRWRQKTDFEHHLSRVRFWVLLRQMARLPSRL